MNGMDSYRGDYGKMSMLTLSLMEDSGWWVAGAAVDAEVKVEVGVGNCWR